MPTQQPEGQLHKQYELRTTYTVTLDKKIRKNLKKDKRQNTGIEDKTYNIKH